MRIPLTGRTLVDEDKLLEQLDFIRISLPAVFQEALDILAQKDEILLEAEEYGQQVVDVAQAKRAQILAESDIIRQAQREADQLRRQVQQDCEAMMQETIAEVERKRRACQQELEEMRQTAIAQAIFKKCYKLLLMVVNNYVGIIHSGLPIILIILKRAFLSQQQNKQN
ncbi:MAG: hypothetical protein RLZZ184_4351 [Cyanobacteriota bacterium]